MKWLYGALALSQVVSGISVIIAKYFIERLPLVVYMECRFIGSTCILALCFFLFKGRIYKKTIGWATLSRRQRMQDISLMLGLALTGGILCNVLMMVGLDYSGAANVGVISATLTPVTMLFSWWLLKERVSGHFIAAVLLSMAGVICLNIQQTATVENTHPLLGNILIFLAIVPEAIFIIFTKILGRRFTALGMSLWVNFLVCIFLMPWIFVQCDNGLKAMFQGIEMSWMTALLFSISSLTAVIFFWALPYALKKISVNVSTLFIGIMPVTTVSLGVFYLRDPFGVWQWMGTLFVLLSLALGMRHAWKNTSLFFDFRTKNFPFQIE
jgi:drug/metabolite transporter (DMT)-like permease